MRAGRRWRLATRFWLTQAPYVAPRAPHVRSRDTTEVRVSAAADTWRFEFVCEARPPEKSAPLLPLGDPDVWKGEYVQVFMPCGEEGEGLHLSVTRDGRAISERCDKALDPIPGWQGRAKEIEGGWQAEIVVPRAASTLSSKVRFARWTPDEGITRWPTPYGSWWHVAPPDFLEIHPESAAPPPSEEEIGDFMRQREHGLLLRAGLSTGGDPEDATSLAEAPTRPGAFLEAFRARAAAHAWLGYDQLPPANMAQARDMLADRFWFSDACIPMAPPYDWDGGGRDSFETVHLTRFDFLANLVGAWRETGDLAFARKAFECIETWLAPHDLRQSLVPKRHPARWSWIILPHRLVNMLRAAGSLAGTELLKEETLLRLYQAVAGALEALDGSIITRHYNKNHSLIMANHAVVLSIFCRELRRAESSRARYFEHFRRALRTQFLPDDVQAELSTAYHMICYQRLTEATSLCEKAGVAVPSDLTDWRRRILTVGARYLTPHGEVFNFNDGGMQGNVDAIGRAEDTFSSIILREGPALGASEALALATHGREGALSPPFSHAMPWAGHYLMRDGLEPENIGLAFDGGPFGLAHAHEDALTLTLTAYGKTLLADLGSGAYDPALPMRRYCISTEGHSTFCVDGCGQASRWFPATWRRQTPIEGRHWFGRAVQFVAGEYGLGYGNRGEIKVEHRRAILFVNGAYLLVFDRLLGEGAHLLESRFIFNTLPWRETGSGMQTTTGTGDLDVRALWPGALAKEVACGQEEPFAGWAARSLHGKLPAPRLTFSARTLLPALWVTLLTPFRETSEIPRVSTEKRGDRLEVRLEGRRSMAHVACREEPFEVTFHNEQTRFSAAAESDGRFQFREGPA